jgi:peptidoglycan/LPS O-acetylase OafA/YrhL
MNRPAPAHGEGSPGYRPDIDGLRAVAVSLVLVFHAFPQSLPGGFAGVDIFFVISGYLISKIILENLDRGVFSVADFYVRRVRRIFPALLTVFAVCLVAGWFLLLPGEYSLLGKHVAGGAGFIANYLLWTESGYFDGPLDSKPLVHLWSLGVEEQFYFLWPLLLYAVWRFGFRPLPVVLCLAGVSFAYNLDQVGVEPSGAYYLPFSRFWELMLGGALARFEVAGGLSRLSAPVREGTAAGGALLLIAAAVLLDSAKPFPGWWGLLPTLGAVALIAAGPQAWVNRTLLSRPWVVGIGLISYPLYLWHWPILYFTRAETLGAPSVALLLSALAVSVAAAWLTYRFIERPIRHGRCGQDVRRLMVGLTGMMATAGAVGLAVFAYDGAPGRAPEAAAYDALFANYKYVATHDMKKHDRQECNFYNTETKLRNAAIDPSCYTPQTDKVVFVWGDSHAQHLQYGLRKTLGADYSVLQVGASGCGPRITEVADDPVWACNTANSFALERIAALRPQIVLIAEGNTHEPEMYQAVAARLRQAGVRHVVLLGPVPQWEPELYRVVTRAYGGAPPRRLKDHLNPAPFRIDTALHRLFDGSSDLLYVSLIDRMCDADGCIVYVGEDPKEGLITYDYGHFTLPASEYVAENLLSPLIRGLFGEAKPQHAAVDLQGGKPVITSVP